MKSKTVIEKTTASCAVALTFFLTPPLLAQTEFLGSVSLDTKAFFDSIEWADRIHLESYDVGLRKHFNSSLSLTWKLGYDWKLFQHDKIALQDFYLTFDDHGFIKAHFGTKTHIHLEPKRFSDSSIIDYGALQGFYARGSGLSFTSEKEHYAFQLGILSSRPFLTTLSQQFPVKSDNDDSDEKFDRSRLHCGLRFGYTSSLSAETQLGLGGGYLYHARLTRPFEWPAVQNQADEISFQTDSRQSAFASRLCFARHKVTFSVDYKSSHYSFNNVEPLYNSQSLSEMQTLLSLASTPAEQAALEGGIASLQELSQTMKDQGTTPQLEGRGNALCAQASYLLLGESQRLTQGSVATPKFDNRAVVLGIRGSYKVLKSLALLEDPLFYEGEVHEAMGKRYTFQYASCFVQYYFSENTQFIVEYTQGRSKDHDGNINHRMKVLSTRFKAEF